MSAGLTAADRSELERQHDRIIDKGRVELRSQLDAALTAATKAAQVLKYLQSSEICDVDLEAGTVDGDDLTHHLDRVQRGIRDARRTLNPLS